MGKVTKLEAARRQVDEAIRSLFDAGDALAVHTLAMAGYQILRDLGKRQHTETYQMFLDWVNPEYQGEACRHLNRTASFLKHADKDADGVIDEPDERINDFTLHFSCRLYRELSGELTPVMLVFCSWMAACYPEFLRDDLPSARLIKVEASRFSGFSREVKLQAGGACLRRSRSTPNPKQAF